LEVQQKFGAKIKNSEGPYLDIARKVDALVAEHMKDRASKNIIGLICTVKMVSSGIPFGSVKFSIEGSLVDAAAFEKLQTSII
jgi:hypothetical protein